MNKPAIKFDYIDGTTLGRIFIATTDKGVCRIKFGNVKVEEFRRELSGYSPEQSIVRDVKALGKYTKLIRGYLSGKVRKFDVKYDLSHMTQFQTKVLKECSRIPFGKSSSYGRIAKRIGNPGAGRAVGGALGKNPVPIMIPCHRILSADGTLGGFSGGLHYKVKLLEHEGIKFRE